jgi:hypothetical protein
MGHESSTSALDLNTHQPRLGTDQVHYGPMWDAAFQEAADAPNKSIIAVLVCHGMGEQVRYETISSVAEAILREARKEVGQNNVAPTAVALACEDQNFLARAEIKWKHTDEGGSVLHEHQVHVYEAYWAPVTQDRVTYWETVKFLLSAAWSGMKYCHPFGSNSFRRWMFGEPKTLRISHTTFFALIAAMLFLLFQVAIIGFVSLELAQQYKAVIEQPLPMFSEHGWLLDFLKKGLQWLSPLLPGVAVLFDRSQQVSHRIGEAFKLLAWFALIAEAFFVRYFLIEYVGDVAAYISPYKDSKFDEIRRTIQKIGSDVAKIVYGFRSSPSTSVQPSTPDRRQPNVPNYEGIVVVGHSLGSVLAYDTLNAMINLDQVSGGPDQRGVLRRTRALVTFGSPLDKTAFLFRMQASTEENWIREQLAASVQPLIVDYKYRCDNPQHPRRKLDWVNIWSPMDVISGSLEYYDDPDLCKDDPRLALKIQNMRDPKANIPFAAHVQYWKNELLGEQLYRFISREEGQATSAGADKKKAAAAGRSDH